MGIIFEVAIPVFLIVILVMVIIIKFMSTRTANYNVTIPDDKDVVFVVGSAPKNLAMAIKQFGGKIALGIVCNASVSVGDKLILTDEDGTAISENVVVKNIIIAHRKCQKAEPDDRIGLVFEAEDVAFIKKGMYMKAKPKDDSDSEEFTAEE